MFFMYRNLNKRVKELEIIRYEKELRSRIEGLGKLKGYDGIEELAKEFSSNNYCVEVYSYHIPAWLGDDPHYLNCIITDKEHNVSVSINMPEEKAKK